jgi:hypothetical protein
MTTPNFGIRIRAKMKDLRFFDQELKDEVGEAAIKPLNKLGAKIRLRAKGRIRRPRRKRLGELTRAEMITYYAAKRNALMSPREALPFKPSAPGEPPRSDSRRLPNTIYYAYDPATKSVWSGPIAFGKRPGEATGALESGGMSRGQHVDARPYMKPSMDEILASDLSSAMTNCLRRK